MTNKPLALVMALALLDTAADELKHDPGQGDGYIRLDQRR